MLRRNRVARLGAFVGSLASAMVAVQAHGQQTGSDTPTLEEVIVTAEKREESLQKTAIAVTALGGDALLEAGVSQAQDLNKMVPGLGIGTGAGSASQIYLRGVGTYGVTALSDPAVAFNVDGVYLARSVGINGNFYDVERVEVLKGPQGTLYGRNATGGAVNLVSAKPKRDFEAGVALDMGNYDLVKVDGFVNLPVTDTFAARIAAQRTRRDGYQTDGYDDDDSTGARVHLLFDPSEQFKLLVTGSYLRLRGKGSANVPVTANGFVDNGNPWRGMSETAPIALAGAAGAGTPSDYLTNGLDFGSGYLDVTVKSLSAQVDSHLGFGDLTVIANHMQTDNGTKSYQPIFLFWQNDVAKQNSLEARLAGDIGPVRWVGGLYYFNEDQRTNYWVDQGYAFNQSGVDLDKLDDTTYAAFGEITYSLTDRLRLIAGARYTHEKKEQDGQILNTEGAPCALLGSTEIPVTGVAAIFPQTSGTTYATPFCRDTMTGERTWNDTSWKLGTNFDLTDSSMLYLTVSRGFKAGGFFASGDHSDVGNVYQPEKLIAYAVGSKNRFWNDRLQLNGEAFYWDYTDHQENYLAPYYDTISSFGLVTQNADAEIYGLDLEVDALLTDDDQLSIKGTYLHGEYTDAIFTVASPGELSAPSFVTIPPSTVCTPTQTARARYTIDCTGQQMPRSPEFALTGAYYHTFNLDGHGAIVPGVSIQYSSSYWTGVEYNTLQKQDAFTTYGATLAYESPEKNFTVTAYGDNLSDEVIYQNSFMRPGSSVSTNALRAPRTYGVRFRAKFQ